MIAWAVELAPPLNPFPDSGTALLEVAPNVSRLLTLNRSIASEWVRATGTATLCSTAGDGG
jgi:hypothetical protein